MLGDYSLLIGGNNAGKSNCVDALRVFYDVLKFDPSRDFPKFKTDDQESWVEIEYQMTSEEAQTIRKEYLTRYKSISRTEVVVPCRQSERRDLWI